MPLTAIEQMAFFYTAAYSGSSLRGMLPIPGIPTSFADCDYALPFCEVFAATGGEAGRDLLTYVDDVRSVSEEITKAETGGKHFDWAITDSFSKHCATILDRCTTSDIRLVADILRSEERSSSFISRTPAHILQEVRAVLNALEAKDLKLKVNTEGVERHLLHLNSWSEVHGYLETVAKVLKKKLSPDDAQIPCPPCSAIRLDGEESSKAREHVVNLLMGALTAADIGQRGVQMKYIVGCQHGMSGDDEGPGDLSHLYIFHPDVEHVIMARYVARLAFRSGNYAYHGGYIGTERFEDEIGLCVTANSTTLGTTCRNQIFRDRLAASVMKMLDLI